MRCVQEAGRLIEVVLYREIPLAEQIEGGLAALDYCHLDGSLLYCSLIDIQMRYVHILEHILVHRLELGLMLLDLLYVRPQEPRSLILQLRPEGLEYRRDRIAEINGLSPLTVFDFVVYVLLTAQQHYQQREIALVHRVMQRCEV